MLFDGCRFADCRRLGATQQIACHRPQMLSARSHQSIIADLHEPLGQHMLQEPMHEVEDRQRFRLPPIGTAVFEPVGYLSVFERFDAIVGDGRPVDIRSQVFQGRICVADRLAVNYPVLLPNPGWNIVEKIRFFKRVTELGPKDRRQGLHGYKEFGTRSQPLAALGRESTAGYDEVDMGMVAQVALPGMQSPHHTDVATDEPGIFGQFLQCRGRGREQQVVERLLVRAGNGPEFTGQGECHQKVVGRQKTLFLFFDPALGFVLAAFGTAAVAARMVCVNHLFAVGVFAAIQMPAHLLCTACDNVLDGPMVAGQHRRAKAIDVIRSVAAEYFRQFDHDPSKIGHQVIDGCYGRGLCRLRQMGVDTGGARGAVSQPDLD